MGFLTRFFQTRDAPKNSTSGSAYSFFMGSSAAGKNVNERSTMQMTAVYACVRILSEAIAGLPLPSSMQMATLITPFPIIRVMREI